MKAKALFIAAMLAAFAVTGCSSGSSGSSSEPVSDSAASSEAEYTTDTTEAFTEELTVTSPSDVGLVTSQEIFDRDYAGVPDAESGPLLKISDTTAKAGETANVTISVRNAEGKWDMCGLHIVYPAELECVMNEAAENEPEYETGPALKKAMATVASKWRKNFPADMDTQKKGALFFTAICSDNEGRDGDIVTFSFKVPENAAKGTVYDLYFYYSSNDYTKDVFSGTGCEPSFEKYAFTHWTGGSVTVE